MSAKITKQEYEERKKKLEEIKASAETLRDQIINNDERQFFDRLNALHDLIDETQNAIDDLISDFETQDWTTAEWNDYALATSNID